MAFSGGRARDPGAAPQASARDKALDLLARRPHFRRELEKKLAARGYPEAEVAVTLDRLVADGLLDDASTAADFVDSKLRRGGAGARRRRLQGTGRGGGREGAAEARKQSKPEEAPMHARAAAERWLRNRSLAEERDRAALARFLERRGFGLPIVYRILREAGGTEVLD